MANTEYWLVRFTDITEAASFVAALTRFLSSPQGMKYLSPVAPAEVLSYVIGEADNIQLIEIYLNAVAVDASRAVFGRLPLSEKRQRHQLPAACILLIGAGGVEAWGVEEAQWHILSERQR